MKKYIIPVIATFLVFVILAQTGLLQPFGIHGVQIFSVKKRKKAKVPPPRKFIPTMTAYLPVSKLRAIILKCMKTASGKKFFGQALT